MATAQMLRTQGKTWEAIFPNEQVTEQKSTLFVKKLLAVAVSNITYLRAIFPEHAFGDKCLEDLNLKILRDESACPGACQVIKWVKGCFDALDKKYLKTLTIGIYVDPLKPETVIESYTFKFSYNNDGEIDIYRNNKKISSAYSPEETKKATIRLLRTLIILTNTMTALPDNVMMTMKLLYYDDVTPTDYEPPGFKASTDSVFQFEEESTNIAVGEIATGSRSNEPVHETFVGSQHLLSQKPNGKADQESCTVNLNQPDDISSLCKPDNNEGEFRVRCPCGCNEDDGLMIMCSKCKFWQHGICFLVTSEGKAPVNHICDICGQSNDANLEPTDPYLCELTSIAIQATCLWRRTLMACTEFKRVVAPQLARRLGIENTVAQGLINRLEKEGYVASTNRGKKLGKAVNKDKILSEAIPCYLKTPKSFCKPTKCAEGKDDLMETVKETAVPVDSTKKVPTASSKYVTEHDVSTLCDKASKMSLSGKRYSTRSSPAQDVLIVIPSPGERRRGRKRAFSKTDHSEFEVANSQENHSISRVKKKASTAQRDIAV